MQPYYPNIKPYATHQLPVSDVHTIYVEEAGIANGIPILFVHGGPGSGCFPDARRFFDPEKYRIILFDQRGCGRSTPHGELNDNHIDGLIADMHLIREQLEIEQWALFGGSWGSTLSLAYAQAYPQHVNFLILRGIFLGTAAEVNWLYEDGANAIFPDYWQDFISIIPEAERHQSNLSTYHQRLVGTDEITRMAAAKAWSLWEGRLSTLLPNTKVCDLFSDPSLATSIARIETHYFLNNCFLKPNQLLANMHRIQHIPGIIVHGRYDMVCRLQSAWQLHQTWPNSTLNIVRSAGHASGEPAMIDALIHATKTAAAQLR